MQHNKPNKKMKKIIVPLMFVMVLLGIGFVVSVLHPTSCCTDPDNDQDNTDGWIAASATLTSEAGGVTGYRLKVAATSAEGQARRQGMSMTAGRFYRLKMKAGADVGDNYRYVLFSNLCPPFGCIINDSGSVAGQGAGTWDTIDELIECPSTQSDWTFKFMGVTNGDNVYLDDFSITDESCTYSGDGWDISTAVYDDVSISTESDCPRGLFFKPDGTKLYELGETQSESKIYQYFCSDAWNLTSCSYDNVNISAQGNAQFGLFFKSDGTKLYHSNFSEYTSGILQYTCSNAWDLSSCSYDNIELSAQDDEPIDIFFKPDGTKLYEAGSYSNKIYQYTCSSAWDLSSCSYDSVSMGVEGYLSGGIFFKSDGTKLYTLYSTQGVYQYSCSSAWNLSSCSYDNLYISTEWGGPLFFKSDGTKLYYSDPQGYQEDGIIYQYSCNAGDWVIQCSDNCVLDTNTDVLGNNILINGSGYTTISANITNYGKLTIKGIDSNNKCIVHCQSGGCFKA